MKQTLIAFFLCASSFCFASEKNDISALNPALQPLYQHVVEGENLAGKAYQINTVLKLANEKAILLEDGYVRIDDTTRYSFLKFKKGYELPENVLRGQSVQIEFRVIESRNDNTTAGMPYLYVDLIRMNPQ